MKIEELRDLVKFELIEIKEGMAHGLIHIKHRTIPNTYPISRELSQKAIQSDVWYLAKLALENGNIKKFRKAIGVHDLHQGAYILAHYWHLANNFLSALFDAGVSCDEVIHMTNYWENYKEEVNKNDRKAISIA